jgi:hypothetical protein
VGCRSGNLPLVPFLGDSAISTVTVKVPATERVPADWCDEYVGAYGFQLTGPLPAECLQVRSVAHWPILHVEIGEAPTWECDYVMHRTEGAVYLRQDPCVVRLPGTSDTPLSDLVHPVLATAGVMAARIRGEVVVHAGAFVGPGGAWVVLGDRGRGKSTFLAEQHLQGIPIVADDICVVRAGRVCAGPRGLDLRPDSAMRLGLGLDCPVRHGERFRVALPEIEGEVSLAGFIELDWASHAAVDRLRPAERLARMFAASGENPRRSPGILLELATLPYLVLRRSPTSESAAQALSLLHGELSR